MKNRKTFMHSGDMGDIIYSLPVIKALGGGKIYLDPSWDKTCFSEEKAHLLMPLLSTQSYITEAALYNGEPVDYNLNQFRRIGFRRIGFINLVESHLRAFELPGYLKNEQWLDVGKKRIAEVVFNRSARYQDVEFPWQDIVERFKGQSIFVGLQEEHEQFIESFGQVPFYEVGDFLELAEIINGADLFIGNQSLSFAISEGLHKRNYLEICKHSPNCNFEREGHNIVKGDLND